MIKICKINPVRGRENDLKTRTNLKANNVLRRGGKIFGLVAFWVLNALSNMKALLFC